MTMTVRLSSGRGAFIKLAMMILENCDRNYPIRGTPDTVPGMACKTKPKE